MAISDDGMSSSESVGFFSQIGNSFVGVLIGIIGIPLSLFLIFQVETCSQAGDAFKKATSVAEMKEGKPVYITGTVTASDIGGQFIKPGKYIRITQSSEIYTWDEISRTEGEGSNKKNIQECRLTWNMETPPAARFTLPACKAKTKYAKTVPSKTYNADGGSLQTADNKKYKIDIDSTDFSSSIPSRDAEDSELILNNFVKSEKYLVNDKKCVTADVEGCERVKITVTPLPSENITFFGKLTGDSLGKFMYKDSAFMSAGLGDHTQALGSIKADDATAKWVGRGVCFIVMWICLCMIIGPITALLDFIPFVGTMGSGAIRFFMGIIAFFLTTITVLLVNFWYVVVIGIVAAIGYGYYKKKNQSVAV